MASAFGIPVDARVPLDQFLLVLTAPLLEWQLSAASQPNPAAAAPAAAPRPSAVDVDQTDTKRVRF